MEKSSSSGSSSHRSRNRSQGKVARIPTHCWCGAGIVEKISKSEDNPYRRYYRCLFAYSQKLRDDPHVFKWVDEAFKNEIEQLDYQVGVLEGDMMLLKAGGTPTSSSQTVNPTGFVTEDVLNEFEMSLLGNVEEVMVEALKKMKRMMALMDDNMDDVENTVVDRKSEEEEIRFPIRLYTKGLEPPSQKLGVSIEKGPSVEELIAACHVCETWSREDRIRLGFLAIYVNFFEGVGRRSATIS